MVADVTSGMVHGIQGEVIKIQADISDGLPVFYMIGYLSYEVKEAKERVRTSMKNSGFHLPPKRICVNLAPADFRKSGTFFDLAIAVALILAMGLIPKESVDGIIFLGELTLDGNLLPLSGVLPILKAAWEHGYRRCIVPLENMEEASLIENMEIWGFSSLKEVYVGLTGGENFSGGVKIFSQSVLRIKEEKGQKLEKDISEIPDFSEVKGQKLAKRALEIAVAGYHNLLLDGPPGVGKSMLASCVPGIMPEMTMEEKIDATMIYSVKGLLKEGFFLVEKRPFRSPSHSVTMAGLFGGGVLPKPGEISLAHHGVLFLDELPEFKREMIEMFRIPLEKHEMTQVRNGKSMTFPADFIFIAAANPCPCGYYPDRRFCQCSEKQVRHYQNKLSGPILDRMDLFVRCEKVSYQTLTGTAEGETSNSIRQRIEAVWEIQRKRFEEESFRFNGRMNQNNIQKYCVLDQKGNQLMKEAFETFYMTGRSYYRILKVARTIADLEREEQIQSRHLEEALMYRRAVVAESTVL